MDNDSTAQDAGRRAKVHTALATVTIVLGAILLAYMVTVESEPGALPLLLLVVGGVWLFVTRARIRSQHK
jgi:zinc transporter ZupT